MSNASQNVVCPLDCPSTVQAHVEPVVSQHIRIPFFSATLQQLNQYKFILACTCISLIANCPVLQSVQILLQGLSSLQDSTATPSFASSANLMRMQSPPACKSLIKVLNRNGCRIEPQRTLLAPSTIQIHYIYYDTQSSTIKPVNHLVQHEAIHFTDGQLVQKDAMRNYIKGLTEIQKDSIHCCPFIH